MSHAVGAWVLNISLTLVVLFVAGLALRAIIKQHKRKKSIGCMGCPYSDSCGKAEVKSIDCQKNCTR